MIRFELPTDRPATEDEIAGAVSFAILNPGGYQPDFQIGEFLPKLGPATDQDRGRILQVNGGKEDLDTRVASFCWRLVTLGLLIPKTASSFHLTGEGRDFLKMQADDAAVVLSRSGLARRLAERCPGLDPVTARYAALAQDCFLSGHYHSAAVMLGVATESAMRVLSDVCGAALSSKGINVGRRTDTASGVLDWLQKVFRDQKQTLKDLLQDSGASKWLDDIPRLLGGGNAIRLTRNEAGHPTDSAVSRDDAFGLMVLFPRIAEGAFEVIDGLRQAIQASNTMT